MTAACFATVVVTGVYSFVSEGASGQDYIQTPPLTGILESAEAPGERNETERGPGVSVKEEPEERSGGDTGRQPAGKRTVKKKMMQKQLNRKKANISESLR